MARSVIIIESNVGSKVGLAGAVTRPESAVTVVSTARPATGIVTLNMVQASVTNAKFVTPVIGKKNRIKELV